MIEASRADQGRASQLTAHGVLKADVRAELEERQISGPRHSGTSVPARYLSRSICGLFLMLNLASFLSSQFNAFKSSSFPIATASATYAV